MKKSYKIAWGVLTVAPILMVMVGVVCFIAFIISVIPDKGGSSSSDLSGGAVAALLCFYGLFFLGIFLTFLVHISYYVHLVRQEGLGKDMKTLWVILFLVLNILAMIVYWFVVVLPEPETAPVSLAPVRVKRIRRR